MCDKNSCDRCLEPLEEKDGNPAIGKLELVCNNCADNLIYCNYCNRVGYDDSFSYGHEYCDNCCDYLADKLMDND